MTCRRMRRCKFRRTLASSSEAMVSWVIGDGTSTYPIVGLDEDQPLLSNDYKIVTQA
jgi:hypothetical protein